MRIFNLFFVILLFALPGVTAEPGDRGDHYRQAHSRQ